MRTRERAAAADVNVQTLRYYERRGLLPGPARRGKRYRNYDAGAPRRVRFIKRAQELGFSLDEMRDLRELRERRGSAASVRPVAATKIRDIEARMRRLAAMRGALSTLVHACECSGKPRHCPIIEALDDEGPLTLELLSERR